MADIIIELAILFITATLLAYISKLFRQPIIPAYILAGIILVLTGLVETNSVVSMISTLGIAFLLFIVGLELEFRRLKDVGLVSTFGGSILCIALFGIGILAGILLGFSYMQAVYIGLVIAFSSTMVVIKLLSDRSELDTLHARIIIGILLVQDLFAIIALFVLSSLNGFSFTSLGKSLGILTGILIILFLASKFILPLIFKYAARTEELLFTSAIAICLALIALFEYLNLSIAIGAFLAGVALANLPYNIEIISLVKPLSDFFAIVFFVSLGMLLNIKTINNILIPIIVLLALTIILKPFLIMLLTSFFGYKKRPSFLISMSLAQTSEFSLILAVLGLSLGHLTEELFSIVTILAMVTMGLTAYIFQFEPWIYKLLSKHLSWFEKVSKEEPEYIPRKISKDVILAGYDRLGYNIFNTLKQMKRSFLVVDYNPEVIKTLASKRIPCMYGDIGDLEILNRLDLKDVKMFISTVPDRQDNLLLIKKTKEANPNSVVIVTSMNVDDALDLYDSGADYVILPHFLGGERMSILLEESNKDIRKLLEYKISHVKELKKRRSLGHRHPKRHRHR
ncbi:cation:proton antiporter [Candidatus Woesearchaeota archaeon]|nr:cation:proton antiporter [Candidatus Woesearchaeota archaeon]